MQNTEEKIYFNFSYFALKLLGKGLYNNPWNAIAELVANGLDAQATSVKLYINMSDKKHSTIEILDNGTGMDYDDLAEKYVFMGKDKRQDKNISDDIRNSYMGRKGIGKLAALYLSKKYYLITKTNHSKESVWVLDTKMPNESDIPHLEKANIKNIEIECINDWTQFETGTMIKLTDVDLTGIGGQTIEGIKARLADFFLLDTLKSRIEVCVLDSQNSQKDFQPVEKSIAFKNFYAFFNNTELDFSNKLAKTVVVTNPNYPEVLDKKRPVQYIDKNEFLTKGKDFFKLKNDELSSDEIEYELKGWIGIHTSVDKEDAQLNDTNFLKNKAYKPNQLRLYIRKKLAVENFFDIYKNNQVFANYIEGEISFDILDDDKFEDIATTNRQSLIQDDKRVEKLIELVKPIIGKLIRTRLQLSDEVKEEIKILKEKAEEDAKKAKEDAKKAKKAQETAEANLESETRRANFLEKQNEPDKVLDALITHIIKQLAGGIENDVNSIIAMYYENTDSVSKEDLIDVLEAASFDMALMKQAAKVSLIANFKLKENKVRADLYGFIEDYINQVVLKSSNRTLQIRFINNDNLIHDMVFSPFEICLFLVNIIDNTIKYKSDERPCELEVICKKNKIIFKNNGIPLKVGIEKHRFFKQGFTTCKDIISSGLGLYHCMNIARNIKANLDIENNEDYGIKLILELSNEN